MWRPVWRPVWLKHSEQGEKREVMAGRKWGGGGQVVRGFVGLEENLDFIQEVRTLESCGQRDRA